MTLEWGIVAVQCIALAVSLVALVCTWQNYKVVRDARREVEDLGRLIPDDQGRYRHADFPYQQYGQPPTRAGWADDE